MSTRNPCCHDCTDFEEPTLEDKGCCTPMPVRRTCEAPALPVPECDEQDPVVEYDPETEKFTVLSVLYDENCSPILDEDDDPITTAIS